MKSIQSPCGYEKQQVLTDVSLKVMPGDFVGLLGPSGSGKTTLLRTVLGAVDLYDGEVLIKGIATSKKRPRVGYVPQLETFRLELPSNCSRGGDDGADNGESTLPLV
ncbi:MAG: hypothetical protein Ct9H300mP11_15740 [Chloroflexota bacterium]|nr:MAG: hypothetical protein Ct9H300mP11_15740 [Chloroflexota bacterium]